MRTTLLNMALSMLVDYVLIIVVCFAVITLMESEFMKQLRKKWNKIVNGFWSIVYQIKAALRKGINYTIKELQIIQDEIKRSEVWDSFKRYFFSWLYFITIAVIIIGIFAVIVLIHKENLPKTYNSSDEYTYWTYLWYFLTNNSLAVSLIASFVGLFLIFIALRPRLSISDKLVQANNGLLRVAITNKYLFMKLVDIQVEMDFMRWDDRLFGYRTRSIPMNKSNISVIYGLFGGSSKSCYIVHSKSGFVWNKDYDEIRCRVSATNRVSGLKHVFEKRYTKNQIQRGAFVGRQFIAEEYRYEMPDSKIWSIDIETRCHKLWNLSETILSTIVPIKLIQEDMDAVKKGINTSKQLLEDNELRTLFPCLGKNADTIQELISQLGKLDTFYTDSQNLNPANKKKRNESFDSINKYHTYLAACMTKDIEDYYIEQKNKIKK